MLPGKQCKRENKHSLEHYTADRERVQTGQLRHNRQWLTFNDVGTLTDVFVRGAVHLVHGEQQFLVGFQSQVHPARNETFSQRSVLLTQPVTHRLDLPAWPGSGLFAVREDHLVVVGDVALDEVEGADRHCLGNQVGTKTVATIKGHEKAECPKVVRLVVLLHLLSN